MTNKFFKLALLLTLLTGCFQTDKSLLDDVTDSEYAYTICKSSCDNQSNDLSDAINKAKIAGVSEVQIEAAKALGRDKANREIEAEIARLDEKCKLENKMRCSRNGCCDIPEPATEAVADATADDAYSTYENARFGFSVDVPTGQFIPQGESGNGDGQVFPLRMAALR
jgi:hypothetical protein